MNKTININLGGVPFLIDEVAFERLNAYLHAIKQRFVEQEIVDDIEARIAEMFTDKLKQSGRSIVSASEVDTAIATMGRPEQFEDAYAESGQAESYSSSNTYKAPKKLYRDGDDRVLGGVVSGVTKYFGFPNPTWFRIFLFLLPFFDWLGLYISTGLVILTYITLWMFLPVARTKTEQMQMRGEAINLDNIERNFNDGMSNVKKKLNYEGSDSFLQKLVTFFGYIVKGFAKILLAIGLFFLAIIALVFVVAFFIAAFSMGSAMPFLTQHIFQTPWLAWLTLIGISLLCLAPAFFFISLFIKLILQPKTKSNMPAIAMGSLGAFIIGFIFTALGGGTLLQDFNTRSISEETTKIPTNQANIVLAANHLNQESVFFPSFTKRERGKNPRLYNNLKIYIHPSQDSTANVVVKKEVNGKSKEVASQRLNDFSYNVAINNGKVVLDNTLTMHKDLWRNQEVKINFYIPENTTLQFDESYFRNLNEYLYTDEYAYGGSKLKAWPTWKYMDNELKRVNELGEVIEEDLNDDNEWSEEQDSISNEIYDEEFSINLGGKELKLNVAEGNDGEANRVQIQLGGKSIVDVQVDETREVIRFNENRD